MRLALLLSIGLAMTAACAAPAGSSDDETASDDAAIVGGTRDLRWSSSGYLVRGASMEKLDRSRPACGATLIAPNAVVTAAHCVLDEKQTLAFGTGDVGSAPLVRVKERRIHPDFDRGDFLRRFDLAVLILDSAVAGVRPAELPEEKPSYGCNIRAIGYHADAAGKPSYRRSAPACLVLRVSLGSDPIFEVHPRGSAGLCVADGDEGSAVVDESADKNILRGIYVGSVTQGITDCRGGWQYLDGYESAFGYRDFIRQQIGAGR